MKVAPSEADLPAHEKGGHVTQSFLYDERARARSLGAGVALHDIYPGTAPESVSIALAQLAYLAASALPLFADAAAKGEPISDDQIELALGMAEGAG